MSGAMRMLGAETPSACSGLTAYVVMIRSDLIF